MEIFTSFALLDPVSLRAWQKKGCFRQFHSHCATSALEAPWRKRRAESKISSASGQKAAAQLTASEPFTSGQRIAPRLPGHPRSATGQHQLTRHGLRNAGSSIEGSAKRLHVFAPSLLLHTHVGQVGGGIAAVTHLEGHMTSCDSEPYPQAELQMVTRWHWTTACTLETRFKVDLFLTVIQLKSYEIPSFTPTLHAHRP